jgi:hypothetical protein
MAKNKNTDPQKTTAPLKASTVKTPKTLVTPTTFFTGGFWGKYWLPALLLVAASFGLYGGAIKFGYLLDDELVIWKNAYVQEGFSGIGKIFGADSFMGYFKKKEDLNKLEGGRYRPLSLVTFAIENDLVGKPKAGEKTAEDKIVDQRNKQIDYGRGNPTISHIINIALYGLLGILLFAVLLGLFPMKEAQRWWWSVPFFGAALFIFHPLHTECVANIKGRDEIMALLGGLGALYAYMKYFDTQKWFWLPLSSIIFLLGLLSKENTLTFLAVIPVTVWFFGRVSFTRALTAAIPLLLAALVFLFMRYNALGYMFSHGKPSNDLMNNSFVGMSMQEKLATIFLTLGWYIKLLLYPHPLTHDYYPYHVPKVGFTDWRASLSLIGYIGMAVYAAWTIRRRSVPAYVIFFFIATISIVSNLFVSVGSFMNERFAFMPSIAFCILMGWLLVDKVPGLVKNNIKVAQIAGGLLLLAMLGLYAYRTYTRVPDWENSLTLNESAVRNSPNSARAQSFYATSVYQELYAKTTVKEEKLRWVDTMEPHVLRALEIYPEYGSAWVMRANVAGARFDADHQMDRLFNEWGYCLEKMPYLTLMRNNMDIYMKYLCTNGGSPQKIAAFAYRTGYELYFKNLKDPKSAAQFLEYGVLANGADARLYNALAEVYDALKQPEKAAEMREKAKIDNGQ